ncbi:MAG TPA: extracellular solute-binding protein [Acidimicrobiia bacterium]|nr:extracellular solute-binding protein [Acidimicrobiia bacterium]
MKKNPTRLLTLLAVLAMLVAACGGGEGGEATTTAAPDTSETTAAADETTTTGAPTDEMEPVSLEWWHLQNVDPMLGVWQEMADQFTAANPHVTIEITAMENEALKAALQTRLQAGDPPDLFQSWGGGGLREQVEAGLVQDITEASAGFIENLNPGAVGLYQVDGVQYGIPYNLGMVGAWYNKALFAEAGIDAPPATWEEYLEDVQTLKDAGITPIAVGAGDKWPAHFYYTYLMIRIGGEEAMNQLAEDRDFSAEPFIEAGNQLQRLIDMEPFQPGFLATPWDGADGEAGFMGSGQAAMDLMGQWAPNAFVNASPDGEGLGEDLGWFPFPEVEGGAGAITDALGGGDGFAVGRDAPPEAVQFLEYLTAIEQANRVGEVGTILPITVGSEDSVTDPNMVEVLQGRAAATFVQLYLDQFFDPELGAAINDAVQTLFAGTATSEEIAETITEAAQG